MIRKFLYSILISTVLIGLAVGNCAALPNPDVVRIAILKDVPEVVVDIRGGYDIVDPLTQRTLNFGNRLRKEKISLVKGAIKLGEDTYNQTRFQVFRSRLRRLRHMCRQWGNH